MNPRKTPIDLLFVIAPHSLLLDIAGPAEAFRLANLRMTERKLPPWFRLRFVGPVADAVTSVGLRVGSPKKVDSSVSTGLPSKDGTPRSATRS